jgi:hypothetical protein
MTVQRPLLIALMLGFAFPALAQIGELPDPTLTPGAVSSTDEAEVCGRVNGETYEKRSRSSLTSSLKHKITRAYGQTPGQDGDHELDHRVPAALGGESSARNVWWQPGRGHRTAWTYHVKDRLDTWAWREVCVNHSVTLSDAQAWFLEPDWRIPYCKLIGGNLCDVTERP